MQRKEQKNRSSQLLFVQAMLVTGFGAVLSYGGSIVGYALLFIGLTSLVSILVWALRNRDY